MSHTFTIKEAVSFGWKKAIAHMSFLVLLTFSFFIVESLLSSVKGNGMTVSIFKLLNVAVSYFGTFTLIRTGFRIYKGESLHAKDIFNFDWKIFGLYFVTSVLYAILTTAGLLLLIIPGIVVLIRLGMSTFSLIDQHLQPTDAIKKSLAMTDGHFWQLFGFSLVLLCINILGGILFGVGLFFTVPLSMLSMIYVYEKLKAGHHSHS